MKSPISISTALGCTLFFFVQGAILYAVFAMAAALVDLVAKEPMFANNPIAVPATAIYILYLVCVYAKGVLQQCIGFLNEQLDSSDS